MWTLHTVLGAVAATISILIYACSELPVLRDLLQADAPQQLEPSTGLWPPNPVVELPLSSSVLHRFASAAVCSDSVECSDIGSELLQRGGSAVDAAIATLLCNGLLAMQSMGLGGGVLMNVYAQAEGRAYTVLAREVAPLRLMEALNVSDFFTSSAAIAVPTEVAGYAAAHERFGKLPWVELVQPTVSLCHAGYALSQHQLDALQTNKQRVVKDTLLRDTFQDANTGDFWPVGTHIRPPRQLCRTYELLAEHGPNSLYKGGELGHKLAADLRDLGTSIDQRDLRRLQVAVVPSLAMDFGAEYRLHLAPPPGSGYILGFIANILLQFEQDFKAAKRLEALEVHRIVEALKFAFVKRWQLDLDTPEELLHNLTCPKYGRELAAMIEDAQTQPNASYYGAEGTLLARPDHGTAHISVLAPNGDAVAATSSINFYFGSGRTGPRTGILFNNALADFAIAGLPNYFDLPNYGASNRPKPGASPMSSMAPLIATYKSSGAVRLVTGAAGGTKIISVLTQIVLRTLWLGEDIKQAIDAPRFHHQLLPDVLEYEFGIMQQSVTAMETRGHETKRYRERGSAVCGIERRGGGTTPVQANADFRKEGGVAGF